MYQITIQRADGEAHNNSMPPAAKLRKWVKTALATQLPSGQLTIRLVDIKEITALNTTYRQKNKPTNVLSFPFELPQKMKMTMPILGDIVVCTEVVRTEAQAQHKSIEAHFAHMLVHGVFHLLGYDHETDGEAQRMEALENQVMKSLGFPNPYNEEHR